MALQHVIQLSGDHYGVWQDVLHLVCYVGQLPGVRQAVPAGGGEGVLKCREIIQCRCSKNNQ